MHFSDDFLWGAATASYQVEGAARVDGRGESIWDVFCRTPGKVYANHNGDVACDQYHRYKEDVALMRDIGIQAYRFSIAWPRIQPTGSGAVNRKGIDYYKRLAGELRDNDIMPVATLYHWDLPLALQERGGWPSRDTAYRFSEYAQICFRELADLIPMWVTLNEPWCVAMLGYCTGRHAPGHTSFPEAVSTIHHLNLAHGLAVEAGRGAAAGALNIGTTLNLSAIRPATRRAADVENADRCSDDSRMYLWPVFGKGYPQRYADYLASRHNAPLPIQAGDLEQIAQPIDFLGFNYYMEFATMAGGKSDPTLAEVITVDGGAEGNGAKMANGAATSNGAIDGAGDGGAADDGVEGNGAADGASSPNGDYAVSRFNPQPQWQPTTDMGWHVIPGGIYRNLQWIRNEVGDIPIYITENGCAVRDAVTADNRVHDAARVDYLRGHLQQIARAKADGVDVRGYFVWSLIDNFEWGFGYSKRFGIVYCDYATLERIPKDSYYFYRDCIAGYVD